MSRFADRARRFLLPALAMLLGCTGGQTSDLGVGVHRVRLVPLVGWEHLDHGREHLFRRGDMAITLADLGPATREGMARELREAREIWLQGRRGDALQRVRRLKGPPLFMASPHRRAEFWRPWHDLATLHDQADSAAVGAALDALSENIATLPRDSLEAMAAYALDVVSDTSRREVKRMARRPINGAVWIEVETWDRITHAGVKRMACVDDGGYLLVLNQERGPGEPAIIAFEGLLATVTLLTQESP